MPILSAVFLFFTMGNISLPGTSSFVGEFMILIGAFRVHPWAAAIGTTGVILGAAYMLTMYKRVVFGPLSKNPALEKLTDLNAREVLALVPIVVLIFWIGIYPKPFLNRIEPTVEVLLSRIEKAGATRYLAEPSASVGDSRRAAR